MGSSLPREHTHPRVLGSPLALPRGPLWGLTPMARPGGSLSFLGPTTLPASVHPTLEAEEETSQEEMEKLLGLEPPGLGDLGDPRCSPLEWKWG